VRIQAPGSVSLILTDFGGQTVGTAGPIEVNGSKTVDLKPLLGSLQTPGTYVLFAVPPQQPVSRFLGTPLVIGVREDTRVGANPGPMVIEVSPLCYAQIDTDHGQMTCVFYYDVAPNTVRNFLELSAKGFYDGLTFHRIVPGFVIQGGDPLGTGQGGPGYNIDAEFNERPHIEGVLSMARNGDPNERSGAMPRSDFANSAGSQFFICLDATSTRALDRRYTAFGRVVEGLDVVQALGKLPIADQRTGRPINPPVIQTVSVKPVTAAHNPYADLLGMQEAQQPTTASAATAPTEPMGAHP